jgi:hypothetical protein
MAETMQQQTNSATSNLVRIKRAAEYFGLSDSFIRHALCNRTIKGYKLSGAVFVKISEIEELISSNKI